MVSDINNGSISEQLAKEHVRTMGSDMDTWLSLLTDDVVFEFPFGTSLGVETLKGKASIQAAIDAFIALLDGFRLEGTVIFPLKNSNEVFVEFDGTAKVKANGKTYRQKYLTHLTVQDGKIARIREFFDPTNISSAFAE